MKIKLYSDPGHAWGAVKRNVLENLGLLDKISSFSYQKGNTVYLEEDCDLPVLVTRLALDGVVIDYVYRPSYDKRSPIRSYPRFSL
jgi:hypothetical protein